MLKDQRAVTMIPATDIEGTRRWYEEVLGFSAIEEYPDRSAAYRSDDSQFNVYASGSAGTAEHTLIGWMTDDIEASVDELIRKGVAFERYDYPGLKTDDRGIAEVDGAKGAWFKDPEGNLLSLWQK